MTDEISKHYVHPSYHAKFVVREILKNKGTPNTVQVFAEHNQTLDDYSYWFILSTCWFSFPEWPDLNLWRDLFSSTRPKRKDSIMKPYEVKRFDYLPNKVTIYRAHAAHETDWISYTLDLNIAKQFAEKRGTKEIKQYTVNRKDILALFLRRDEDEIIVLDKEKVIHNKTILI